MNQVVEQQSNQMRRGMASANSDASKAIAEVHAAMTIAQSHPRNEIQAIDKITNAFTRVSLAEVAQYQYAKGGTDIVGPSIRSAEAIAQLWGNMQFGFREISRGIDEKGVGFSEIEAYAWDIENNTKRPTVFIVKHWRDTRNGGYKIEGEREIYELTANMAQRRVRACILAVIPGDVVETAMRQAAVTLSANADVTPEGVKKMVDAFEGFGVTKEQIEVRIQRRLDAIQPAQMITLKRIYASLRDGMSEASEWFDVDAESVPEKPKKELLEYPEDKFKTDSDDWKALIMGGKKKAADIINMLKMKWALSENQENTIYSFEDM